jgi:CRP-like cAMP-binding protein
MQCIYSQAKLLQRIPLFADLDAQKLQALAFSADHVSYATGERLYTFGQEIDAIHVVLKGKAKTLHRVDGHAIADIGPGEVVGCVPALADSDAPCDVVAEEPVEALLIQRPVFMKALEDNPKMAMTLLKLISRRYVKSSTLGVDMPHMVTSRHQPLNA